MVIPVEQTCPVCGDRFLGSDMVGLPCMNCTSGGFLDETVLTSLAGENIYDSIGGYLEVHPDDEGTKLVQPEQADTHQDSDRQRVHTSSDPDGDWEILWKTAIAIAIALGWMIAP